MSRGSIILALKVLTSLGFGWILLRVARSPEFGETVRAVDPPYVVLSLILSAVMVSASCLKWWFLLRSQDRRVGFLRLMRWYLIGYYFTCLMPSNIGGDVARSYYVGKDLGSQSDAAVSVLLERLTGLAVLLVLVLVCPLLGWSGLYRHPAIWIPAAGAVGLLVLMGLAVRVRQPLVRAMDWVRSAPWMPGRAGLMWGLGVVRDRTLRFQQKLRTAAVELKRRPGTAWPVWMLSLLFYALSWLNVLIAFRAFGHEVPFGAVVAVLPTAMVVAMLPVAPLAGLGLAEGAYVFYFGLVSVGGGAALAMGLLLRCKLLLLGALGLAAHVTLPERMREAPPASAGRDEEVSDDE